LFKLFLPADTGLEEGGGGRHSVGHPLYPLLIPSSPPPCPPILMHPCSPQLSPPPSPMFLEEPIGLKQTLEIKNKHSEGYFDSPPLSCVYVYHNIHKALFDRVFSGFSPTVPYTVCTNVYIDIRGGTNISPLCKWNSWKFKAYVEKHKHIHV
jgi:hypothetical protein